MNCTQCQKITKSIRGTIVDEAKTYVKPFYGLDAKLGDTRVATIHTPHGAVFGLRVSQNSLGAIEGHEKTLLLGNNEAGEGQPSPDFPMNRGQCKGKDCRKTVNWIYTKKGQTPAR